MSDNQTMLAVMAPNANAAVHSFRQMHDSNARADLDAHISLLFPFLPPAQIDESTLIDLKDLFATFDPFPYHLNRISAFGDKVLYLEPKQKAPFKKLTEGLIAQYPQCQPYGGVFTTIKPHLTVARELEPGQLAEARIDFASATHWFLPICEQAHEVALLQKENGAWKKRETFKLGR